MDKKDIRKIIREAFEAINETNETLLRKDMIQKFYDMNGLDTLRAENIPTFKEVDGVELAKEEDVYNDLGVWKSLWNDVLSYAAYEEELEEGAGRSHTIAKGKNKKPANYPWIKNQ